MSVTPEELAAFADGQLEGEARARVAAAIAADPALARQLEAHRALADRLARHYAPIAEEQVPDHLAQMLGGAASDASARETEAQNSQAREADRPLTADRESSSGSQAEVVDFAAAREKRASRRILPAWGWGGGAIAAALVAALVFTVDRQAPAAPYAGPQLASALDRKLAAGQARDGELKILLSFRNEAGEFCRAYSGAGAGGIACRDSRGWRQEAIGAAGPGPQQGEYRMASSEADIFAAAQAMAAGPALSAEEERAARAAGWQD